MGRQWETTTVKNFPRKIIVERILSTVIADARNRVWHLGEKKIVFKTIYSNFHKFSTRKETLYKIFESILSNNFKH